MIEIEGARFYDIKELSEKLGITKDCIRSYVRLGKLQAIRFGSKYMIPAESVRNLLQIPENNSLEIMVEES
jgi:excisionase family DNA binding protein